MPFYEAQIIHVSLIEPKKQVTGIIYPKIAIDDSWKQVIDAKIAIGGVWKNITDVKLATGSNWKNLKG